jgi:CheY-like chemotaxis protein
MSKVLLLIEDDPLMLRMYRKIFKLEGYQVELAAGGQEGLDKAKSDKPTLVLLDIMMPKMDGFEVLGKLKEDPETKDIPVVVLTNLAGTQDAKKAMEMGALKYIIKSEQDPKEVATLVKEVLENLPEGRFSSK